MKTSIIIIALFSTMHFNCIAQKGIVYNFESPVTDSLQSGISMFAKLLNRSEKELKLYAVIIENNHEFEIFLQEYSHLPRSGFFELITNSNRKIKISSAVTIPVVIPIDRLSLQVQKDKIAAIPLRGYYIKVLNENYNQKVVQTSVLL